MHSHPISVINLVVIPCSGRICLPGELDEDLSQYFLAPETTYFLAPETTFTVMYQLTFLAVTVLVVPIFKIIKLVL